MKTKLIMMVATLALSCWVTMASADTVHIVADTAASAEHLASYEGYLTYTPGSDSTKATLKIDLTSITNFNGSTGGYLTAIAFNNPGNSITGVTKNSFPDNFEVIGGPFNNKSISVEPYGSADIGASISNSWLAGGNPNKGVPVGNSAAFIFDLTGTNLDQLNAMSFLNALTTGGGKDGQFFLARFRGFGNGGSDKVPAAHAPLPASALLLGSGLLGLGFLGWRRKSS